MYSIPYLTAWAASPVRTFTALRDLIASARSRSYSADREFFESLSALWLASLWIASISSSSDKTPDCVAPRLPWMAAALCARELSWSSVSSSSSLLLSLFPPTRYATKASQQRKWQHTPEACQRKTSLCSRSLFFILLSKSAAPSSPSRSGPRFAAVRSVEAARPSEEAGRPDFFCCTVWRSRKSGAAAFWVKESIQIGKNLNHKYEYVITSEYLSVSRDLTSWKLFIRPK